MINGLDKVSMKTARSNDSVHLPSPLIINHQSVLNSHPLLRCHVWVIVRVCDRPRQNLTKEDSMKRNPWKLVLLLISVGILAGFWAAAQAPVPSRPLAEWMPGGALLYLESSDFAAQLRDWNRSKMKSEWLASKNHEHFMTTRLILKLKDVYGEFSNAAGF